MTLAGAGCRLQTCRDEICPVVRIHLFCAIQVKTVLDVFLTISLISEYCNHRGPRHLPFLYFSFSCFMFPPPSLLKRNYSRFKKPPSKFWVWALDLLALARLSPFVIPTYFCSRFFLSCTDLVFLYFFILTFFPKPHRSLKLAKPCLRDR